MMSQILTALISHTSPWFDHGKSKEQNLRLQLPSIPVVKMDFDHPYGGSRTPSLTKERPFDPPFVQQEMVFYPVLNSYFTNSFVFSIEGLGIH